MDLDDVIEFLQTAFRRWRELLFGTALLVALFYFANRTLRPSGAGLPTSQAISRIGEGSLPLLASAIALGVTVMAIIQLLKPPLRAGIHRREIARWLRHGHPERFLFEIGPSEPQALLELPIEQLTAQIQAAAEVDLSSGRGHFVYEILGEGVNNSPNSVDEAEIRDRTRLGYLIQRRLDALQIRVHRRWRKFLRVFSLTLSGILVSFVGMTFGLWKENFVGTTFLVLVFAVLGGFFASVTRDMVAIIERLRNS